MHIIIQGTIIITIAVFSLSAYAYESCSCDVCLTKPEQKSQKQTTLSPTNLLSLSYSVVPYNTIISGTSIQPSIWRGLVAGRDK